MSEVTIRSLEQQLKDAKATVERRDMAVRLASNPDFKKLVLDGFCLHEAARYVQASTDPALGDRERADSLAVAQASGHFRKWMQVQMAMGYQASLEIRQLEDEIEAMRQEGGE